MSAADYFMVGFAVGAVLTVAVAALGVGLIVFAGRRRTAARRKQQGLWIATALEKRQPPLGPNVVSIDSKKGKV